MANLDVIRGRSTVLSLTNQSGAARSPGDLVVIDTANDESFTVSTSSNTKVPIGIVDETIGIGSNGRVVVEGYARYVKTLGTSARGDYLFHSTTSATAAHMAGTAPTGGAFGYVEDGGAGTATTAYIFPTTPRHVQTIAHSSNTYSEAVTLTAGSGMAITSPSAGTLNLISTASGGGGSTTLTHKHTIRNGGGNITTTSTTKTPIDATNLAYLTLTLAVNDVVECSLTGTFKHTGSVPIGIDFEVDQPTSANVYIGAGADYGCGVATPSTSRVVSTVIGRFVATEAGSHGFRPVWLTDSGTATLCNAASGNDDALITYSVFFMGAVTA